jgi:hypothetical protein
VVLVHRVREQGRKGPGETDLDECHWHVKMMDSLLSVDTSNVHPVKEVRERYESPCRLKRNLGEQLVGVNRVLDVVYYEVIKWDLKRRPIHECPRFVFIMNQVRGKEKIRLLFIMIMKR